MNHSPPVACMTYDSYIFINHRYGEKPGSFRSIALFFTYMVGWVEERRQSLLNLTYISSTDHKLIQIRA